MRHEGAGKRVRVPASSLNPSSLKDRRRGPPSRKESNESNKPHTSMIVRGPTPDPDPVPEASSGSSRLDEAK
eukprot:1365366-Karenia_brevis.AAC.1